MILYGRVVIFFFVSRTVSSTFERCRLGVAHMPSKVALPRPWTRRTRRQLADADSGMGFPNRSSRQDPGRY